MTDFFEDMGGLAGEELIVRKGSTSNAHVLPCEKCRGTGMFRSYTGRVVGKCLACKGVGTRTFKTDYATRQKATAARHAFKAHKSAAWTDAHPTEVAWINAKADSFDFARAMQDAIKKYGALTENQLATVQRLAARDAERSAAFAVERAAREANAPTVTIAAIETAFAAAIASGRPSPKLRLDTFIFSPAKAHGKNPGAIYVKEGEEYLGKIAGGKFVRVFKCSAETEARVVTVCADPEQAAIAYGRRVGRCSVCARVLTKGESIDRGIGPICSANFGWG